ncbi:hypothetical protein [Nitrosomonas communis]|uniref:hypothetical protein n=1 Tax=Nitrosomonas communis TaxID=44574 RepID=UPI003D2B3DCF
MCVVQNKTGAKLRIIIEGELAVLLARISARKAGYKVISMHLIVNETGQPIKLRAL